MVDICETLDGLPLGIELAAARMAAMSASEVRDRLGDRFRMLKGAAGGPDRQQTLRHAVAWSYDLLTDAEQDLLRTTSVFAGGFDLAGVFAVVDGDDEVDVLEHLDSLVRKSLVVADHTTTRTRYGLFETIRQFAEDRLSETGAVERMRDRHAEYFAREAAARWDDWDGPGWRDAVDWVELELANLRAGFRWSAARGEVDIATDIAAHSALMGFSVQLFETLAWAEELIDAASIADVRRLPRLYTGAGYACFAGRAEAGRAHAHRATELEVEPRYEACEPGYATFIEALCEVYCGDLDRYVELTGEVARLYGRERGYGLASYVDGLQASGRVDEAIALDGGLGRRGARPRQSLLGLLRAVDRGSSPCESRRSARSGRVGRGRGLRAGTPRALLRRVPRADAARLHTSDGEPEAALVLFFEAVAAFQRAGNVPQLIITLASVPALFERIDRPEPAATLLGAMEREPSSFHHVPELEDLGTRLTQRLGEKKAAELTMAGAALDLNSAAVYTRAQIDIARRNPIAATRPVRGLGASAGGRSKCCASSPTVAPRARSRRSSSSRRGPPSTTSSTCTRRSA